MFKKLKKDWELYRQLYPKRLSSQAGELAGGAAYEFRMSQKEVTVKETTLTLSTAEGLTKPGQKLPTLPIIFIGGGK